MTQQQPKTNAPLPFASRLQPTLPDGGFRDPDWWIWCGSCTRNRDGLYHLFSSRWPRTYPWFTGYLSRSEVVRATAERPEGPFEFQEVVLPPRHPSIWDGRITHNPAVIRWRDKWLLFYIGLTFEHPVIAPEELSDNNEWDSFARCVWWRLRIGMAVADDPAGPWSRPDEPTFAPRGINADDGYWDYGVVTNPAPFIGHDGAIYFGFRTTPDGHLGIARAETPDDPFELIVDGPILPKGYYVEDITIWWNGSVYEILGKDGSGHYTGIEHALMHGWSPDLHDWRIADQPLVLNREIEYANGETVQYAKVERASVMIEDGKPHALFCAVADGPRNTTYLNWHGAWNVGIPLAIPAH